MRWIHIHTVSEIKNKKQLLIRGSLITDTAQSQYTSGSRYLFLAVALMDVPATRMYHRPPVCESAATRLMQVAGCITSRRWATKTQPSSTSSMCSSLSAMAIYSMLHRAAKEPKVNLRWVSPPSPFLLLPISPCSPHKLRIAAMATVAGYPSLSM